MSTKISTNNILQDVIKGVLLIAKFEKWIL